MDLNQLTTYQAAVTQSRANRALKARVSYYLRAYDLTMMQWSVIGLIAESKSGLRISDLAKQLDTSLAFITTTINVLEARGIVVRMAHGHDSRAKLVKISDAFRPQIKKIEEDLRVKLCDWLTPQMTAEEISTYMKVLDYVAQHGEDD